MLSLFEWVQQSESEQNKKLKKKTVSEQLVDPEANSEKWLILRARVTIMTLLEEWLRDLRTAVPLSLREEHLDNLRIVIESLEQINFTSKIIRSSFRREHALVGSTYHNALKENAACDLASSSERVILFIYMSKKLLFSYSALLHPDYLDHYAPAVRNHVGSVVNADMSCVTTERGSGERAVLRAEALNLQAQIDLRDAAVARSTTSRDQTLSALRNSVRATKLGLHLIQAFKDDDTKARTSSPLVQRISSTPTAAIDEKLRATGKDLAELMKAVDEND